MIIPLWPTAALFSRLTAWSKTPTSESPLLQVTPSRNLNPGQHLLCRPTRTISRTRTRAKADGASFAISLEEAPSRMPNQRVLGPLLRTRKTLARQRALMALMRQPNHLPTLRLPKRQRRHRHQSLTDRTISVSLSNGSISALVPTSICASSPLGSQPRPKPSCSKRASTSTLSPAHSLRALL